MNTPKSEHPLSWDGVERRTRWMHLGGAFAIRRMATWKPIATFFASGASAAYKTAAVDRRVLPDRRRN